MKYYTPLMIIVLVSLIILGILTKENARASKDKKKILYFTYLMVALSALAEWVGIQFSGNPNVSPWLIKIIKFLDYALTPIAGGAIILQFQQKNIWTKILFVVIGINVLFQEISIFADWMIVIDATNTYSHGPLYLVYIILYIIIISLVVLQFALYGKRFKRKNRVSLYSIFIITLAGILMQEIFGKEVRMAYISLTICLALLYIHDSEFSQQASDAKLRDQMIKISEDPLTGLLNRYAYNKDLKEIESLGCPPIDLVVFSIDVNGLKLTNDTLGHSAGDELICGAANCISKVFSQYGKCYRTGGDEFIVLAYIDKPRVNKLALDLTQLVQKWRGKDVKKLSLSIGYSLAAKNIDVSIEQLIVLADREMYKAKNAYYKANGLDRRMI